MLNHFIIYYYIVTYVNLLRKAFLYWEGINLLKTDKFPKFCFFHESSRNTVRCFFEISGSLCSFLRDYLPSAWVWITTPYVSTFQYSTIKAANSACNSKNGTRDFSWSKHHISAYIEWFILESHAFKGWDEIKLIILTASLKTFLNRTGIFTAMECNDYSYYLMLFCLGISSFTHFCFCSIRANIKTVK